MNTWCSVGTAHHGSLLQGAPSIAQHWVGDTTARDPHTETIAIPKAELIRAIICRVGTAHQSPMHLLLAVLPAALMLTGCAHSMTQSEMHFLETRDMQRPFDQTYDAAVNALFSLGLTINHSDKSSGIITGTAGDYGHKASLSRWKQSKYHVKKVTLLITPRSPAETQIRMKVLVDEEQQLDRKLMTAIWQRIAREALLEDPPPGKRPPAPRRG